MAKQNKQLNEKEIQEKLAELKVQLLNQKAKRKNIKKEIARLLTLKCSATRAKENKK
jgi:ribosomal protein L29